VGGRLDLASFLLLLSVAGAALIVLGTRLTWATADLDKLVTPLGTLPEITRTVRGTDSDRHATPILLCGVGIGLAAIAGAFLQRVRLASLLVALLGVSAAILAVREAKQVYDLGELAKHLGAPVLATHVGPGLPLIWSGAALAITASAAAMLASRPAKAPADAERESTQAS
jgi:hypothetical protein